MYNVSTDTIIKTDSGNVALNCHSYLVMNNSDADVEVDGVPVPAQSSFNFPYFPGLDAKYNSTRLKVVGELTDGEIVFVKLTLNQN